MAKYSHIEIEKKFQKEWDKKKIYAYQTQSNKKDFVIDTPPPTVSGSLHIGHIFSYTQTDIIARFKRMSGKNVFYPMGWDDNGLPTEKRVQSLYAIQCDPTLNYDPHFKAQKTTEKKPLYKAISRQNFLEICEQQVLEDEIKYKNLWKHIALSVDWDQNYRTISPYSQSLAQYSFIDLYKKNLVENRLSPVPWDTQFQTAVAQADIEDRQKQTFYNDIAFDIEGGGQLVISTTRPEMLPACVTICAHPTDDRYKKFFGKQAISPLFKRKVPILSSEHANPEKGTGILMICTFGDMEDVAFCKKQNLAILQIINEKGFFIDIDFTSGLFKSENPLLAKKYYSELKNLRVLQARKKIIELLKQSKNLIGDPKPHTHYVKFYEKGDFPLEIIPKRQWYIKILDHKQKLLEQANQIKWHPSSMKKRYEQWVEGLNQDWCISRQRLYGVPFPVWYKIDDKGSIHYDQVLIPHKINQALDPLKQAPPDFKEEQRNQAMGFKADSDVMDTWATSSLTPFINSRWIFDKTQHAQFFPADLRPQAHEIIRTWAFYSIVKSYFHEKKAPWKNIAISGWVITPDKIKMSKSKGNALTPENLIKTYSADAVRYWSAKTSLGQDTIYDENLFRTGKRLVTKIFNASQFVKLQLENKNWKGLKPCCDKITETIDRAWMKSLLDMQKQALDNLEEYKHKKALELVEKHFWLFCDNYLELTKARVYQSKGRKEGLSGQQSLSGSLYCFLQLLAPYMPYVTEEIWKDQYDNSSSLHQSLYPDRNFLIQMSDKLSKKVNDNILKNHKSSSLNFETSDAFSSQATKAQNLKQLDTDSLLDEAFFILEEIRNQKSALGKSLASPLSQLKIHATAEQISNFDLYKADIERASQVDSKNIILEKKPNIQKPVVAIRLKDIK
ncbi:MAG: valine--tRNA ligase [Bdellovibrionaceae bacterium]|nr:valine--tRNA ligase [Pseudobdellovibrionaceae bacterium]